MVSWLVFGSSISSDISTNAAITRLLASNTCCTDMPFLVTFSVEAIILPKLLNKAFVNSLKTEFLTPKGIEPTISFIGIRSSNMVAIKRSADFAIALTISYCSFAALTSASIRPALSFASSASPDRSSLFAHPFLLAALARFSNSLASPSA